MSAVSGNSTSEDDRLRELLTGLARAGPLKKYAVETGEIFHSRGLHFSGKFFAFVRRGEVVIKLPAHRVTELVASQAGRLFDARRQRPMKEWVVVRPTTDKHLRALVIEAGVFVASLARAVKPKRN